MRLTEALPSEGLVCVVGAGGKKSTLYALANALDRAVVTATVRIPVFDDHVARVEVTDQPVAAVRAASEAAETGDGNWPLGLVPEQERPDRYRGYDPETVADLAANVSVPVLVKADGARSRWLKAPNEREPQVPATADAVCPVASVRVVGEPLAEERVHRPERVAAVTGRAVGDELTADDVARVLTHPDGGLKDVPDDATVVPILNMVDDAELAATAHYIAARIHDYSDRIDRVVLTCFADEDPVVDVV
ncbi:selenium cofactor biosynthesis protein YqeC [Haloarchaeobius sp. DFWS5]|uniref:selenium cofactor biosynthesis protein YqeC n=1 Tax=Haloarchaeobius sp. DFWS5 TaxID=3446114 RepID=UPI003EC12218